MIILYLKKNNPVNNKDRIIIDSKWNEWLTCMENPNKPIKWNQLKH